MSSEIADDVGKLVLRITLGVLLLLHGVNKLIHGVSGIEGILTAAGLPAALAYGALIGEVVAPVLVLLGYYARVGAALIVINMIFAVGLAHSEQLLLLAPHGGWQLELQGFFLLTALALAFTGPGRLGINRR